jgi:hypothetical protein
MNNAGKSKAFPEMMAVSGTLSGKHMEALVLIIP